MGLKFNPFTGKLDYSPGDGSLLPAPHAPTHFTGGTDPIAPNDIGAVPQTRTVVAGTGLTGGGDLSANRTFQILFGTTAGTVCEGNDPRLSGGGGGVGATGATGPSGGPTGATGATGATGIGSTGATGLVGATGIKGSTGATGSGATGSTGLTGDVGATGSTGATGASGATGVAGNDGATGATGVIGNDGATGATGIQGPTPWTLPATVYNNGVSYNLGDAVTYLGGYYYRTGNPLNPGFPPTPGSINASWTPVADGGATGPDGATGLDGATGSTGATGVEGSTGATGIAGADGATGATGIQGDIGSTGATGATGLTGVRGATGATGDIGATGPAGAGGALGYYGSFYDLTDQPLVSTTTEQVIAIGNTVEQNGVSIVNGDEITFANAGTYSLTFSVQITNLANSVEKATFWLKTNNVDYPDSATEIDLQPRKAAGNPNRQVLTLNFVATATAGQQVQIYWSGTSTDLTVESLPAGISPVTPAVPSIILTAVQVMNTQIGLTGATGATGIAGSDGATGATGVAGADGATGATGAGTQGATGATGVTPANIVLSDITGLTGATQLTNLVEITQTGYDLIVTPDPNTLYVIVGP